MKTLSPTILAVSAAVLLLGGCVRDDPTIDLQTVPEDLAVEITAPADGARIEGNVVELEVAADGLEIVPADGDTSGATGHFHVFIDRDPVASGETIATAPDIIHFSRSPVRIPGFSVGSHRLTVVLGDGAHVRMGTSASIEVEILGPSITSTAPEDAPQATGFTIQTEVQGVEIGDSGGDSGMHLDLILNPDQDPEADGRPIPTDSSHIHTTGLSHQVAGLPEGRHTIWVVLTDAGHVPVRPMVADKLEVNVR